VEGHLADEMPLVSVRMRSGCSFCDPKRAEEGHMTTDGNSRLGRLFVLDLSGGRIFSISPDGSDRKIIATECRHPDGVVVDAEAGHIYWTNMGVPNLNDGSIERADVDGLHRKTIVPLGATFTPKQLHLDKKNKRLYWSDREGMRVMRSNLDGSSIEVLVDTSQGNTDRRDASKWCVGITVDADHGHIYWTQKGPDDAGQGRIFRANAEIPKGQSAANRTDVETLFDGLPEPIDLELDVRNLMMYWTDRGDPPRGNTVNRSSVGGSVKKQDPEIILTHLMEGIGIALDVNGERMFLTDLGGSVYSAKLDGTDKKTLLYAQGNLAGIAYAELPSRKA
jgi:Low-density lipoprotein receptor repeat class B